MSVTGIIDNYTHGKASDFLIDRIKSGCDLRIVSAYFSIYAYYALRVELASIGHMKFLFGEPHYSSDELGKKREQFDVNVSNGATSLNMELNNRSIAMECAQWLEEKSEIKSVSSRLLHGKLYHVYDQHRDHAMLGSSNFTLNGLGIHGNSNLELNLVVDSDRDREALKAWFEEIWNDESIVEDVKASVLKELRRLYTNYSPEFVYFKTLFEIFESGLCS